MTSKLQSSDRPTFLSLKGLLLALSALTLFGGCTVEFEEDFDTKFTVPPPVDARLTYYKTKRFKMKKDPGDAEHVELQEARLRVVAPDGADLSFINEIEIYACSEIEIEACHGDKATAELTPVGFSDDFSPGDTSKYVDIIFGGDLRRFVKDKRIVLSFRVKRSAWRYDWPDEGVQLEAAVVLLVEASPL